MREFFKPWRRKAGVVALVMACVFAAGWVRSTYVEDYVNFGAKPPMPVCAFHSVGGCLIALLLFIDHDFSSPVGWISEPAQLNDGSDPILRGFREGTFSVVWRWRWKGFDVGEAIRVQVIRHHWIKIPYWSVVAPLTLLAAWLLLTKPRPAKKPEPAPTTGAGHA